jgi:hypothetical protein
MGTHQPNLMQQTPILQRGLSGLSHGLPPTIEEVGKAGEEGVAMHGDGRKEGSLSDLTHDGSRDMEENGGREEEEDLRSGKGDGTIREVAIEEDEDRLKKGDMAMLLWNDEFVRVSSSRSNRASLFDELDGGSGESNFTGMVLDQRIQNMGWASDGSLWASGGDLLSRTGSAIQYSRAEAEMDLLIKYHEAGAKTLTSGLSPKYAAMMTKMMIESSGLSLGFPSWGGWGGGGVLSCAAPCLLSSQSSFSVSFFLCPCLLHSFLPPGSVHECFHIINSCPCFLHRSLPR